MIYVSLFVIGVIFLFVFGVILVMVIMVCLFEWVGLL